MLKVYLRTDADSRHELILPASRWDVLESQARLGIDSLNDCYLSFEPPADVPQAERALCTMGQNHSFFDELNYFAQRLSEMSHSDRILLNGAIAIHGPEDMKTLINLTWHTDNIVMGDAGSDSELGRFLLENDFVSFPEEVIPYLDFAKIGQQHRAENSCAFDRNIYYQDLELDIQEVYDGRTLPEIPDKEHVFVAEVSGGISEFSLSLALPATQRSLDAVLKNIGAQVIDEVNIDSLRSRVARFSDIPHEGMDLAELDLLADSISKMDDSRYIKYLAVLKCEDVSSLSEAHDCAHRLDEYDFTPGIRPRDVGSFGPIQYTGQMQELTQAPEPQQTQDFEMGGQTF